MAKRRKTPDVLSDEPRGEPAAPHSQPREPDSPPDPATGEPAAPVGVTQVDPVATLFAQRREPSLPFSARVQLTVAAPESLTGEVERAAAQAFRSLSDVLLVEADADWTLLILGVELRTRRGDTYGVALSVVVTEALDRHLVQERLLSQFSARSGPVVATAPTPPGVFRGAWLQIGARPQVQSLCQGIVADFNARYLDAQRRSHQQQALASGDV